LETGESATTSPGSGRISQFDDVDDYDGWCRGAECTTPSVLETFDGYQYDGNQGYPDYSNFTRRVTVRNLFPIPSLTYTRNPYASYTGVTDADVYQDTVNRFEFENWSTLRVVSGEDATGRTPLKIIEIIVTYDGTGAGEVEVEDLSFAVMPVTPPTGGM
jgi:hypothetical protein